MSEPHTKPPVEPTPTTTPENISQNPCPPNAIQDVPRLMEEVFEILADNTPPTQDLKEDYE